MELLTARRRFLDLILGDYRTVGWLYGIMIIITTSQEYFPDPQVFDNHPVLHYNNYIIFKQSFFHLLEGKDLYMRYWEEHYDLFKYSPTFSLLFSPLAVLPDFLGLLLWNALNAGLLFLAIRFIPLNSVQPKILVLLFILPELITSTQNSQSNALMAALIILSFNFFEKDKLLLASLCLVFGFYIKLFSMVGAALFLFYPGKLRFLLYLLLWLIVLCALPLLVIPAEQLAYQYQSWLTILQGDYSSLYEYSIMAWLKTWFGFVWPKVFIIAGGIVLFCMPVMKFRCYEDQNFRLLFLCSILLWVVIFNFNAESPTFVIAMSGVGLWFFTQKKTIANIVLVILAFIFASMSRMDFFPQWLREDLVEPYVLKGAFCIFVWFKILVDLMRQRPSHTGPAVFI